TIPPVICSSVSSVSTFRHGHRIIPIPTRIVSKENPPKLYFEIYNLGLNGEGQPDYDIKYQVLTLQKKPSVAEKILGVGIGVAQIFFPYQVFLGQVGMFGVEVLTRSETKGLKVETDDTEEQITGGMVSEIYELDTTKMPKGYYAVYATVKDHINNNTTSNRVSFAVGK
ncbi:hypothetical protein ACFLU6_16165, partial [Acidobacteriota bacterium]